MANEAGGKPGEGTHYFKERVDKLSNATEKTSDSEDELYSWLFSLLFLEQHWGQRLTDSSP